MKLKFILLIILAASYSFAQHGVGSEWSDQVKIPQFNSSAKQRGVLYNNIVTTSDGRIIISTSEHNPSNINQVYGYYLTYSDSGGISWLNPPVRFTPFNLVTGGSGLKLAITSGDTIIAILNSASPSALLCSKLDKNLNVIEDSIRIANKINYNISATHLTIDRYDRIHIMWNEGSTNSSQITEVYYTRSTDRGLSWQPVQLLSSNDGHHSAFPHSQFDTAGDTLAIVWRDSVGGLNKWDVFASFSTDGGQSWSSSPVPILNSPDSEWDPDLIIDNQNRIHLFYTVYPNNNPFWGARNYYRYSDDVGNTWHLPNNPSDGMISDNYRSQLLEGTRYGPINNVLFTTWKDERDFDILNGNVRGDIMLRYSTDRGLNRAKAEFVTDAYDSTIGFKGGHLLSTGEYCINYELIYPEDINNPSTYVGVFFKKRNSIITSIYNDNSLIAKEYFLNQNYPNPFNASTTISFTISYSEFVTLKIYDVLGNEVATIVNENLTAGIHSYKFNAGNLTSGVYIYKLQAGKFSEANKMILLKQYLILIKVESKLNCLYLYFVNSLSL